MKMRKSLIALSIGSAIAIPAHAQSSVTLYGLIDAGIDYTNNSAGHPLYAMQSGITQGNRWGIRAVEDLGGATNVVVQLENGFNPFTGKLGQGGLMFGRQAYVGLANPRYGTLTLGRQYDSVVDVVQTTTFNGKWGAFFSHPSDFDNTDDDFRVNNVIKYVTPRVGGFAAEGMYAFGGSAGAFRQNSTIAGGASYANGPLYIGAAYFYARDPASQFTEGNFVANATPGVSNGEGIFGYIGHPSNEQIIGVGATYKFSYTDIGFNYTNTTFNNASGIVGNTVRFDNYELWANVHITPATTVGAGYSFTKGTVGINSASPKYGQLNMVADYILSKRTDVYVMGVYQHAMGGANADIYQAVAGTESTTPNQVLIRLGMRHKF
jgi:predicted porin